MFIHIAKNVVCVFVPGCPAPLVAPSEVKALSRLMALRQFQAIRLLICGSLESGEICHLHLRSCQLEYLKLAHNVSRLYSRAPRYKHAVL